jgi:sporadic carbohydrate cluster 2OG-Fe(II) oxygenase
MNSVAEPSVFSDDEADVIDRFLKTGYIIFPVENTDSLAKIRHRLYENSVKLLKLNSPPPETEFFDNAQNFISQERLNEVRLGLIDGLNKDPENAALFHSLAKNHLGWIVGNEMAIQRSYNLGIQLPKDSSSILPLHSDVWSGNSPYEVVLWTSFVDCHGTKSMYLLPLEENQKIISNFQKYSSMNAEELFEEIKSKIVWLEVPYGHAVIFWHGLLHGNRVNEEEKSRWTVNLRFKGLLTPYNAKELGEYFMPLTIRPITRLGYQYQKPKI